LSNRPRFAVIPLAVVLCAIAPALTAFAAQPPPTTSPANTLPGAAGTDANPLARMPLYVDPHNRARAQAARWRASRPADAALLERIGREPHAMWVGGWYDDVQATVAGAMRRARAARQMPVFVAYNIPHRDCFGAAGGGASGPHAYRRFIAQMAAGIGRGPAVVVLEPDALPAITCLAPAERRQRMAMLRWATARLARGPETAVYIDAGHARWVPAPEMARRLRAAGVARARGFALNVSNFHTTAVNRAYGRSVSRASGGARFVIDTGRNGAGPRSGDWCNPPRRALGAAPTVATGDPLMDAGLWIKAPGESDGRCNGGPAGGVFWPRYALDLARRAGPPTRP
jgi:endoglucanase